MGENPSSKFLNILGTLNKANTACAQADITVLWSGPNTWLLQNFSRLEFYLSSQYVSHLVKCSHPEKREHSFSIVIEVRERNTLWVWDDKKVKNKITINF